MMNDEAMFESSYVPVIRTETPTFVGKMCNVLITFNRCLMIVSPIEYPQPSYNIVIDTASPFVSLQTADEQVEYSESRNCFFDQEHNVIVDPQKIQYFSLLFQKIKGLIEKEQVNIMMW